MSAHRQTPPDRPTLGPLLVAAAIIVGVFVVLVAWGAGWFG